MVAGDIKILYWTQEYKIHNSFLVLLPGTGYHQSASYYSFAESECARMLGRHSN